MKLIDFRSTRIKRQKDSLEQTGWAIDPATSSSDPESADFAVQFIVGIDMDKDCISLGGITLSGLREMKSLASLSDGMMPERVLTDLSTAIGTLDTERPSSRNQLLSAMACYVAHTGTFKVNVEAAGSNKVSWVVLYWRMPDRTYSFRPLLIPEKQSRKPDEYRAAAMAVLLMVREMHPEQLSPALLRRIENEDNPNG